MKAAVLTSKGCVRVVECERPVPAAGEAVVKVELASLCGTDNDFYNGELAAPRPSGHEFTGQVVALGPGVRRFASGDRVVAAWGVGCGRCPYCAADRPNLCDHVILFEGTHAEYIRIPHADRALAHLPDDLSYRAAIVMACSLSTGGYGVRLSNIGPADTVMILGLGAVGLCMVLYAAASGPRQIIAVDTLAYRRDWAVACGAHEVGDPTDERWLRAKQGSADVVLIATANPEAVATAVFAARKAGRITVISSQQLAEVPFERFDHYGLHLTGTWSMIGGDYMAEVVADVASGRIAAGQLERLVTHVFPLGQIQQAYDLFASYAAGVVKIAIKP
jgi:threonine dehydrogenase-like Zn-dependent dehydrogenase